MAKVRTKDCVLIGVAVVALAGASFLVYRIVWNPDKPRPIPVEQTLDAPAEGDALTDPISPGGASQDGTQPVQRGPGFMRPSGP